MKDPMERLTPVPDYTIRTAVVVSSSGGAVTVNIAGGQITIGRLKTYAPIVGETVVCLFYNGDGLVMGAIATH